MTTETIDMDFSEVGSAAMQAASTSAGDGLLESESSQYNWLWEMLYEKHLTDMVNVKKLASLPDLETLSLLRNPLEIVQEILGFQNPQAFQISDLPRLTNLLKEAHRLAHNPDELYLWASRPNK